MNAFTRLTGASAVCGLALGFMASAAQAQELVMSSWLPPQHPVVVGIMQPWAEEVAEVTGGRVTVRMLPSPLGPPPAHFDLAADGVADITYGLHSFTQDDRFLRSRIGQFSFLGDTAEATSVAYWDVYAGMLDAQAEHEGTKLLGLFVHGPGMFHNNQRAIESPEDFSGLKVRTPGGYIADLATELGITTQFIGPGQVFESLSTGVIDGVTFPIEALNAFNLVDHITHSMRVPGGIYNTSWFLAMNEDVWDGISEEDQAAIEAVSGQALAALAGQVWDAADQAGVDRVAGTDIVVSDAPESIVTAIEGIAQRLEAEWAAAVTDTGYDGEAALSAMREATGIE
ncbi:MAG: TRAP transporter substrate-binding protein [Pseudomonadota bacterium]